MQRCDNSQASFFRSSIATMMVLLVVAMPVGAIDPGLPARSADLFDLTLEGPAAADPDELVLFEGRLSVGPLGVPLQEIGIYHDGTLVGVVQTDSDGAFNFEHIFGDYGDHEVVAVALAGSPLAVQSPPLTIEIHLEIGDVSIGAGDGHTCLARLDGSLYCWGRNDNGQLGDGTTDPSTTPVHIPGIANVVHVAAGLRHTCALVANASVYCWGGNNAGQLGDNTTEDRPVPTRVTGLGPAIAVDVGTSHSCAVTTDGKAFCWGSNSNGRLGVGTISVPIPFPSQVSGLTEVVSIAPGWAHTCATTSAGELYCWGRGLRGEIGNGSVPNSNPEPIRVQSLEDVTGIFTGSLSQHSCAILADGSAWCWGLGSSGQLGNGVATNRNIPVEVVGISDVTAMSGSSANTCATVTNGTLYCWGHNTWGTVGDGTTIQRTTPVPIVGPTDMDSIVGGSYYACAADSMSMYCWGTNSTGQLGDGTTTDRWAPVPVTGFDDE